MRYRDLAREPHSSLDEKSDNTVLLHVRRGEMPRLAYLIREMDIRLYGSVRRMPTGNVLVEVACRDAATASALLERW